MERGSGTEPIRAGKYPTCSNTLLITKILKMKSDLLPSCSKMTAAAIAIVLAAVGKSRMTRMTTARHRRRVARKIPTVFRNGTRPNKTQPPGAIRSRYSKRRDTSLAPPVKRFSRRPLRFRFDTAGPSWGET